MILILFLNSFLGFWFSSSCFFFKFRFLPVLFFVVFPSYSYSSSRFQFLFNKYSTLSISLILSLTKNQKSIKGYRLLVFSKFYYAYLFPPFSLNHFAFPNLFVTLFSFTTPTAICFFPFQHCFPFFHPLSNISNPPSSSCGNFLILFLYASLQRSACYFIIIPSANILRNYQSVIVYITLTFCFLFYLSSYRIS